MPNPVKGVQVKKFTDIHATITWLATKFQSSHICDRQESVCKINLKKDQYIWKLLIMIRDVV